MQEKLNMVEEPKRRFFGKKAAVLLGAGGVSVLSIGCLDGALGFLLSLLLAFVGASPLPDFDTSGQVDLTLLSQNGIEDELGGESGDAGKVRDDVEYIIEVESPEGTTATIEFVDVKEAKDAGTFSILLDSSGSMEQSFLDVCPTCPHDPSRKRVEAAQIISKEVLARSPESRMSIFDWGEQDGTPFSNVRTLQDFTSSPDALIDGAEKTSSNGATYIYDSLNQLLELMSSDIAQNFQTRPIDKGIIVVTDGEDTHSQLSLDDVIAKAKSLEIPIHVVGLGPANEKFNDIFQGTEDNSAAVKDLRRLAAETGGFYASVDGANELQELAEFIAIGLAGGYTTTRVTLDPIPESGTIVKGTIFAVDPETGKKIEPGEPWDFVAP